MTFSTVIYHHLQGKLDAISLSADPFLSLDEEIGELCSLKYAQKIERDKKQNIESKFIAVDRDSSKLLFLRDARNVNDNPIDETYNFAGIGLNYLIAAKRMLLVGGISHDEIKKINFTELGKKLIAEIHNGHDVKDLAQVISDFLHVEIEPQLKHHFPNNKDIRASLEKWAAWASLEMPTPAVATIHSSGNSSTSLRSSSSSEENETFIQLDIPQTRLTPEIKAEWEYARFGVKTDKPENPFHWFDHGLNEEQQKIAQCYAPLILKGDRSGPAQLRDKIPGLKNAYEQLTLRYNENVIYDDEDDDKFQSSFTVLNQVYHSATVVYVPNVKKINSSKKYKEQEIKNEKLRLSILGLKQQQLNAGEQSVHYFTLNSKEVDQILGAVETVKTLGKSNYYGVDTDIVIFSQKAAQEIKTQNVNSTIFVSNFCLNEFRVIFSDSRPGIAQLERQVKNFYELLDSYGVQEKVKSINEKNGGSSEISYCIDFFRSMYQQYFGYLGKGTVTEKVTKAVAKKMRRLTNPLDTYVNNLQIMTIIGLLLTLKNRILQLNEISKKSASHIFDNEERKTALYVGCASGDNRTGILLTHMAASSVGIILNNSLLLRFTRAGHTQEMSGGSLCTCGIRGKSKGAFPAYYSREVKASLLGIAGDIKSLPKPAQIVNEQEIETEVGTESESESEIENEIEIAKIELKRKINQRLGFFAPTSSHPKTYHSGVGIDEDESLIDHIDNSNEDNDPFKEICKTIDKYLTPLPDNCAQPSKEFITAITDYFIELKEKHDIYENGLKELNGNQAIPKDKASKMQTKIMAEKRDLETVACNFNTVLNTLAEKGELVKKRNVLMKFKQTIPKQSRTDKFLKFFSLALSLIIPPLHLFALYQYDKGDTKRKSRNDRIAGGFKKISNQLDEECHRQESIKLKS